MIGNPRSGTTLLRLMINSHRNMVIPPECGFAVWWHDKYKTWNLEDCGNQRIIELFIADLATSKKMETWNLNYDVLRDLIASNKPQSYGKLVSLVYICFAVGTNKNIHRWGDKNNFHILHMDRILEIFEKVKFLFVVRDGRDVACSYQALAGKNIRSKYAPNLPNAIDDIAKEWEANNNRIIQFMNRQKNYFLTRYEDLVTRPQIVLADICSFLDEEFDGEMLQYHRRNTMEGQEPKEFLQWKEKILLEPTTSEIGKYKVTLRRDDIKTFEQIAGDRLTYFGYQLS